MKQINPPQEGQIKLQKYMCDNVGYTNNTRIISNNELTEKSMKYFLSKNKA